MLEPRLHERTFGFLLKPNDIKVELTFNLQAEIKGLSNVEQVLLDTADSVLDTKKKLEFGVQQIIFKVDSHF